MSMKYLPLYLVLGSALSDSKIEGPFLQSICSHFHSQFLYFISIDGDPHQWSSFHKEMSSFTLTSLMRPDDQGKEFSRAHRTIVVGRAPVQSSVFTKLLKNYEITTMKWVIFVDGPGLGIDNDTFIPFNCELLLVTRNNAAELHLTEVYSLGKGLRLLSLPWGSWSERSGLVAPTSDLFTRRQNLDGHLFHLVAFRGTRFDPDQIFLNKMVGLLGSAMNFTMNSRYWELGVLAANGTMTGTYQLLRDGLVDFGTQPFVVTPLRLKAFTFIWPITTVKTYLFVAVGDETDWSSYLKPFDAHLWFVLGAWMVLSGFCLCFLYRLQDTQVKPLAAVADAVIHAISPYCAQGGRVHPHGSVFLCRFMPYINALVLLPAYSGAVLAFLTVPLYLLPFHDIDGFVQNGHYKLSFLPYTYIETFFSSGETRLPEIVRERQLMLPDGARPADADGGFRQMCSDHSVVYIDSVGPDDNLPCHILRLQHELLEQPIGIAATVNFPYKTLANRMVRRVHSAGLMKLFQEIHMPPPPAYVFTALDLDSVVPLFILLFLLTTTALAVFLAEKMLAKRQRRRQIIARDHRLILAPAAHGKISPLEPYLTWAY